MSNDPFTNLFTEVLDLGETASNIRSEDKTENSMDSNEDKLLRFRALQIRADVAELLGLTDQGLRFQLYGQGKQTRYKHFEIPKKSGIGTRKILAPNKPWKKVQHALLRYLELFYEPRSSAHGFIGKRSVLTNASPHLRKRWVLNLDLKDFFRHITFRRVFGLFLKKPFSCPREVAVVLAQIVTHEDELPQGSPTSPLISNMIAARLDSRLNKLAKKFRCRYTRYADDITFSSIAEKFPAEIAEVSIEFSEANCRLGNRLVRLIEDNGFQVNEAKVRVRTPRQRQEVTGLVVNRKLNVPREFVREVRAILYDWKNRDLEECARRFSRKVTGSAETINSGRFKQIVHGKIDYIGAVRGRADETYLKYLGEFARLAPDAITEKTTRRLREQDFYSSILDKLIVVEVEYPDIFIEERDGNQGTAFFLKDVGLITCAHLFQENKIKIEVFRRYEPDERVRANIDLFDDQADIAGLWHTLKDAHYFEPSNREVKLGDPIFLTGFPKYSHWNIGFVSPGTVTGIRRDYVNNPRIQISANIISGNSGGPVFDKDWKVIGIAARGADDQDGARETEFHGVIPLSEVYRILGLKNKADS